MKRRSGCVWVCETTRGFSRFYFSSSVVWIDFDDSQSYDFWKDKPLSIGFLDHQRKQKLFILKSILLLLSHNYESLRDEWHSDSIYSGTFLILRPSCKNITKTVHIFWRKKTSKTRVVFNLSSLFSPLSFFIFVFFVSRLKYNILNECQS